MQLIYSFLLILLVNRLKVLCTVLFYFINKYTRYFKIFVYIVNISEVNVNFKTWNINGYTIMANWNYIFLALNLKSIDDN